jgi:PEP-CTERM motif
MKAISCSIFAGRRRKLTITTVALASLAFALSAGNARAGYDLQTLNDPADQPFEGLTFTNLLGINNSGLIAGFYGSGAAGDPNKGFLLTPPSTFTPENFPGSAQTQMTGLNDDGVQVGYLYTTNNGVAFDNQFGFVLEGGKFTEVNDPKTPTPGQVDPGVSPPIENQLIGVNDHDIAVGFYNDAAGNSHGYTYNINTKTFSADIDDPNAVSTVAAAINNSGEIAGFYTDSGGETHGFLDKGGVFTTVDPAGATETQLLGLNDQGVAVGFDVVDGFMHGIIFNSVLDTFTTLDPPNGLGTTLNGINNRGDIVGFFVDAAGNTDGLLATPVPEPATWAMMLAGLAGLGLVGFRRSRKSEIALVPA